MAEWFIKNQDDQGVSEEGPFRPSELLDLVRLGRVVRETIIRKDNSAWFQAGEVGGLFEAAMRPTIEYFCPHCSAPISQPPCNCPKCDMHLTRAREKITENSIASTHSLEASSGMQRWLKKKMGKKP